MRRAMGLRTWLAACLLVVPVATLPALAAPAAGAWPGRSLYQLPVQLTDGSGATRPLAALAGRPVLVAMFYADCTSACPLIVEELKVIERTLAPAQRARLGVAMASFDAAHETDARLAHFATMHHVDDPRWLLARTDPEGVRLLAAALGVRYRPLPNGQFNHTSVITLLDAEGVPVASTAGVGKPEAAFIAALAAQVAGLPDQSR